MGTLKLCLFLLLLAVAAVPNAFLVNGWTPSFGEPEYAFFSPIPTTYAAATDDTRRLLFQYGFAYKYPKNRYLSYDALKKNNVPCGHRGSSYYNCNKRKKANPYRRGCTAMSGCARFTD